MRFLADGMLGRLARRLRSLGFDTSFYGNPGDIGPLGAARCHGRFLLTRNTALAGPGGRGTNCLVIRTQVVQVLDDLGLWNDIRTNCRCVVCNAELRRLERERSVNLVAPYVLEHGSSFSLCPDCGRVYWKGIHCSDMEGGLPSIIDNHKHKGGGHADRNNAIA